MRRPFKAEGGAGKDKRICKCVCQYSTVQNPRAKKTVPEEGDVAQLIECLPGMHKAPGYPTPHPLGIVAHDCIPSTLGGHKIKIILCHVGHWKSALDTGVSASKVGGKKGRKEGGKEWKQC